MPSYAVTGVSRGLGWEILTQLSSDPNNKVIGIVRNKAGTEKRVAEELKDRSNISIIEADLNKYDTIKAAADQVAEITGGSLDYLIANAGFVTQWDAFDPIGVLGEKHEELDQVFTDLMNTNVLANIHLYNLFMPLILKGKEKKVAVITSGHGDTEWVAEWGVYMAPLYATSKAAMNMITAKFSAQYKKDGVLFLGICPGFVDVGHTHDMTEEQMAGLQGMMAKFVEYSPEFKGPVAPPGAIKDVLSVLHKSSIENGNGGAFISHLGTKRWI